MSNPYTEEFIENLYEEALDALVNELSEKDEFQLLEVKIGNIFDYDDYMNRDA